MAHSPRSSQRGCFARSIDIFVTLALRQHLLGLNIGSTLPRRDHVSQKSQYNLVNTVKISLTVGEGGTKHTALALVRPRGGLESGTRQATAQTGGARRGPPELVARNPKQPHRLAQRPCSCLPASVSPFHGVKNTLRKLCKNRPQLNRSGLVVRARGLEPPILSEPDPKSGASAIPPRAQPSFYWNLCSIQQRPLDCVLVAVLV